MENENADIKTEVTDPVPAPEPTPEPTPAPEPEPKDEPAPMEDYSFGDGEEDGDEPKDEPKDEDAPQEYSVEWPEDYEANEDLTNMVNSAARECGVTDKALGAYTARMIELLEAKHAEQLAADDAALKEAWGRDFLSNKKAAQAFMGRMMKATGLTKEDMQSFANPRGFKVLHALSQQMGGGKAYGLERKPNTAELDWAKAAMGDRNHADFKALNDSRDPRHREVTQRYFRAMGANV